jgi:peptide/nickel transport system substrate-binding protein
MYAHTLRESVMVLTRSYQAETDREATMPKRIPRAAQRLGILLIAGAVLATTACTSGASSAAPNALGKDSLLVAADNGSPTFQRNFNPFSATKRIGANEVYEPLMVVNALDGKETPFLSTGYTMVNPKTIDFTIRQGVKWSDGKPFTPQDVAFTFQLLKKFPATDSHGVWQQVSSVSVSGNVVEFSLKAANVTAARAIEQQVIVPEHIWSSIKDPTTYTDANPVGTGPYKVGQFTPNQYTMVKNKSYWQADKVAVQSLVYPASNTQLDLVNKGYDWAYGFISDVKGTWVKADPGHNSYWFPPGGVVALMPNLKKAPFNNVDVRSGLSAALDRTAIANDAEEGYVKGAVQTGLLLPNEKAWINTDIPNQGNVSQSTTTALKDFALAGYTKQGNKLVDSSGKQLSLTITTASGYTDWLRGVQTVEKELEAIGINVKIAQPQPAAYQQALATGDFDLAVGSYGGTGSVYTDFNNLLNGAFAQPIGTSTSQNFERFSDPKVDAMLASLRVTPDMAGQKKIVDQLQQVVYQQTPVISMFYGGLWGLYSNAKFTGWPSASNPYASPIMWDSTPLLVLTHLTKAK